ncbi:MAG TPA: VWA domain-containing protein [Pyrinomonadaceae bacterium]|jgi:VWFA-related protein|nr:VWA domain-containing protein [Pyrinomonadaceae bacterium]
MRKIAAFVLLLSLFLVLAPERRAQSRARRVGQPATGTTTAPPPSTTNPSRPPVLGGAGIANGSGSGRTTTTTPASAPANNEPEEVGEGDIVRVNTTLVTVPVSVMDRAGKYVPDLRQENFRIFEDGVEQEVKYFASVEKPFTVALVIDTSGSTRFKMEEIQDAALAFIDQLRPDDRVLVVSFNDDVKVLAEATNDRNVLRNAIRRTRTGDGTRLYDAIDLVINQRFNRIDGRKAIVVFTDGVDTTSKRASYESTVRDAEELDALIYPVQYDTYEDMQGMGGGGGGGGSWPYPGRRTGNSPMDILIDILGGGRVGGRGGVIIGRGGGRGGGGGGTGSTSNEYARADAYLRDLASKTGARGYRADSVRNISQAFALIAEELRRQYSLGYYPKSVAQGGQRRQIRVRVNQPGLVVRARDSYISSSAQGGAAAAQSGPQQQPQRPELRRRPFTANN